MIKILLVAGMYFLGIAFLVMIALGFGFMLFWDVQDHRREREDEERDKDL